MKNSLCRKIGLSVFLFFFLHFFLFCEFKKVEPIKFNYGEIPYGKTVKEVLNKVKNAHVEEELYTDIYCIGEFGGLNRYFEGGLYNYDDPVTTCFNSKIVKKYAVSYERWGNISEINLYFVKQYKTTNSYTLFLVEKILKTKGNYINVFNGLQESITEAVGMSPKVNETEIHFPAHYGQEPGPAMIGIWAAKNDTIFLLTTSVFKRPPIILYLSNSEWQKYLNSCMDYEEIKKQKEEKEGKKAADDF